MNATEFRCEGDAALHKTLLEEDDVKQARKKLEDNPSASVRRQLLATSVRLTESMSPKLHAMMQASKEKLGVEIPIETFVYNSPQFNAACVKPEDDRLLLMFSSSLLEKFDEAEVLFVMGHELGHHLFAHHDIPVGMLVGGKRKISPRLALQVFSWSRYAEISADRAGAICADDADGSARALFKLASGLTTDLIEIRIDDFASQADEMNLEREPRHDEALQHEWFLTHPFTPLRVKALQVFVRSEFMEQDGVSRAQLESNVHELMAIMSPTYLQEDSAVAETMRRVLFAAGCGLMNVAGEVSKKDIEAFDNLFGEGSYRDTLDLKRLEERLEERIKDANESVPLARRIHIIRDLCVIAVADDGVNQQEREYIFEVGRKLELDPEVIEHHLKRDVELD